MGSTFIGLISILLILSALWSINNIGEAAASAPMIVFGDSLVDQGNNNYLFSIARCDYLPYGVDYPGGATGRFCNGRIISDFLSQLMGTEPILPCLSPQMNGDRLLTGANFGSAGCGIADNTGSMFIGRLTIPRQLEMFGQYQNALQKLIGQSAAAELIRNAIYNINVGGNDWINNYVASSSRTPASDYTDFLISTYAQHLKKLYSMGARKIVVTNIGPIGCAPSMLNRFNPPDGQCVDTLQQYAMHFNGALKLLLDQLTGELPGSLFVYSNGFDMMMDFIKNPKAYGFEVVNEGCCGQGKYKGYLTCTRLSSYCRDRTKYLFWDAFHPTETTNMLIAKRVFYGPTSDIMPLNVQQLIHFNLS